MAQHGAAAAAAGNRQRLIALGLLVVVSCSAARAADMTAREVTALFYKARPGEALDLSGKDLSFSISPASISKAHASRAPICSVST